MTRKALSRQLASVALAIGILGCADDVTVLDPAAPQVLGTSIEFVGAGDIADCGRVQDDLTALLLDSLPNAVVYTTGDNVYGTGTTSQFERCYGPSWGRHRARTRPAPGNHDYETPAAIGYYAYYGANAGPPLRGYYSYDLGEWHIISLNSNVPAGRGSAQEQWLREDLAANPKPCTLAYWHHPLFSSGSGHGNDPRMSDLFQALYDARADVVLAGHEHHYERFAPQDASQQPEPARGIRTFVVGTGGAVLRRIGTIQPNSEARNDTSYGVLKLTLHADRYDWEFIPIAGQTFRDSGSDLCVKDAP